MTPKAHSVTQSGEPDDFVIPRAWRAEVFGDGTTRIVVSVPAAELAATHLALLAQLSGRQGLLYVQLTDRKTGALEKPKRRVAMELPPERVRAALEARPELIWSDARHQLWHRGALGEQLVLDEMGLLYAYPDDPSFRDALDALGIPESSAQTLDQRDYVKVAFASEADAQEESLWQALNLIPWNNMG